ncbi:hypothetical protein CENSYa_0708 [Cenarchaeum symbiosum A]|uniref:Uncharacterized protein n=1 Tax=Cenarchaeum symbiosum (strain A) TaxID=414004 RepID=A0RVH4_CENSY|nr:hypothetical protein CENSYa_0708 [Cenarchaeum symbiosum A]
MALCGGRADECGFTRAVREGGSMRLSGARPQVVPMMPSAGIRIAVITAALFVTVGFAVEQAHAQQLVAATLDDNILEIFFDGPVNASNVNSRLITFTDGISVATGTVLRNNDLDKSLTGNKLRYALNDVRLNLITGYGDPRLRVDVNALGPGLPDVAYGLPGPDYAYPHILDRGSFTATEGSPQGLAVSPDGSLIFVTGSQRDEVLRYVLSAPYNLDSPVLDGSYNVQSEEGEPRGVAFSDDGTRMFVTGDSDSVYQYSLGTPFAFDGAVSLEASYDASSQDNQMSGIDFSLGGSRMYLVGDGGNNVYHYNLENPYNIAAGVAHVGTFDVTDADAGPRGVVVSADGRTMLVLGQSSDRVHRYDMDEPYNVTTSFYAGSMDVSDQGSNLRGLAASADGRRIFVSNTDGAGSIHRYDLGSPYDAAIEGVGAGPNLDVSVQESNPSGVAFSADGTRMFVTGSGARNADIHEYSLDGPYDVSSATFVQSAPAFVLRNGSEGFELLPLRIMRDTGTLISEDSAQDVDFSANGRKMYVVGIRSGFLYQYALDSAYAINTARLEEAYNVSQLHGDSFTVRGERSPTSIVFNPAGTVMLVTGRDSNDVHEYFLDEPFNLDGRTENNRNLRINNVADVPTGLAYSSDGNRLFISTVAGLVIRYDLPNPYSLSGAKYVDSRNILDDDRSMQDVAFTADGRKMFAVGRISDQIFTYNLTAPFDIAASGQDLRLRFSGDNLVADVSFGDAGRELFVLEAESETVLRYSLGIPYDMVTAVQQDSSPALGDASLRALEFSPNGTLMFAAGWVNLRIDAYNMSTPFDVSAIQPTGDSFDPDDAANKPPDDVNRPTALRFSSDGTMLFVLDQTVRKLFQYDLESPYSIDGTPRFVRSLDVVSQLTAPQGFAFSADGTWLHITGASNDRIARYALGTAYDLSTASHVGSQSIADLEDSPSGIAFNGDGTRMFVSGSNSELADSEDNVYAFALSPSVPITPPPSLITTRLLSGVLDGTELTLEFDNPVDATSVVPGRIHVRDGHGMTVGGVTPGSFSVSGMTVSSTLSADDAAEISRYADPVVQFEGSALSGASGDSFPAFDVESLHPIINRFAVSGDPRIGVAGSFRVNTESNNPEGLDFNPDGTIMFVLDTNGERLLAYNLSVPYEASTAVLNATADIEAGGLSPRGLHVSTDGTRFYTVAFDNLVRLFEMSIPFDITSAVNSSTTLNVSRANTAGRINGVELSPDGTHLFTVGEFDDRVHRFDMSTANDISTAVYHSQFNLGQRVPSAEDVTFSPDGLTMLLSDTASDTVVKYTLDEPYGIAGAVYAESIYIGDRASTLGALSFTPDGLRMTVADIRGVRIIQYDLPGPYELSWPGQPVTGGLVVIPRDNLPGGATFVPDGETLLYVGATNDELYACRLGIPYDVSTLFCDDGGEIPGMVNRPTGVVFADDGLSVFISSKVGSGSNDPDGAIYQFGLMHAFARESAFNHNLEFTGETTLDVSGTANNTEGLALSGDGNTLFVLGNVGVASSNISYGIQTYNLPTSFELAGAVQGESVELGLVEPTGLAFTSDGMRLYIVDKGTGLLWWYDLSLPYSILGISASGYLDVGSVDTAIEDVILHSRDSAVYLLGSGRDAVYGYGLGIDGLASYALITPDRPELGIESAVYDSGTGALRVVFTDDIEGGSLDPAGLRMTNGTEDDVLLSRADGPVLDGRTASFELGTERNFTEPSLGFDTLAVHGTDGGVFPSQFAFPEEPLEYAGEFVPPVGDGVSGVAFSTDGSKMFASLEVIPSHVIAQYPLTEPFNSSNASTASSRPVGGSASGAEQSETGEPSGVAFSPGGAEMFVSSHETGTVARYHLVSEFEIDGAVYLSNLDTTSQDPNPTGLAVSADGGTLFISGNETDSIYSYELSLLDVEGARHRGTLDVSGNTTDPTGVSLSGDGLELFLTAGETGEIHRYTLALPYSLDGAVYDGSFDTFEDEPQDITFSPDGLDLYVAGPGGIHRYLADTAVLNVTEIPIVEAPEKTELFPVDAPNISDASPPGDDLIKIDMTDVFRFEFNDDDPRVVISTPGVHRINVVDASSVNENIARTLNMGTPVSGPDYDITVGDTPFVNDTRIVDDMAPKRITFIETPAVSDDDPVLRINGTLVMMEVDVGGAGSNTVVATLNSIERTLTVVFDREMDVESVDPPRITVVDTDDPSKRVTLQSLVTLDDSETLTFSLSDDDLITLDGSDNLEVRFDLGALRDTAGGPFPEFGLPEPAYGRVLHLGSQDSEPTGLAFSNDGMRLFVSGKQGDSVYQYSLGDLFNITSATFDYSRAVLTAPEDLAFSRDGSLMLVLGTAGGESLVYGYSLERPFDISEISLADEMNVTGNGRSTGMTFSDDGTDMLLVRGGGFGTSLHYVLSDPFNVSSATLADPAEQFLGDGISEARGIALSRTR